jgi:uncharacterized Fe-S center protein
VLSRFPQERVFYVSVLKNITERYDCVSDSGRIVCPDIGYLSDSNPIRIDTESIRMIKERSPGCLDFGTWNLFEKISREVLESQKNLEEFNK